MEGDEDDEKNDDVARRLFTAGIITLLPSCTLKAFYGFPLHFYSSEKQTLKGIIAARTSTHTTKNGFFSLKVEIKMEDEDYDVTWTWPKEKKVVKVE